MEQAHASLLLHKEKKMPKEERTPRRGRYAESALRTAAVGVESISFAAAVARLPLEGPVAQDTSLGWDSNSSNDGYPQGQWNPVTDPRPSMRERLSEMTTVTWGRMKINFNRLLEQMTAVLPRPPRLLAGKQNSPLDAYFLTKYNVNFKDTMTWREVLLTVMWASKGWLTTSVSPRLILGAVVLAWLSDWDWRFISCWIWNRDHKKCSYRYKIGAEDNADYERKTLASNPRLQQQLQRAQNSTFVGHTDVFLTLLSDVINVTASQAAPEIFQGVLQSLANAADPLHGTPDRVAENQTQRPWLPFVELSLVDNPTQPQRIEDIGFLGDMWETMGMVQSMANAVYLLSDQLPNSSILTDLLPLLGGNSTAH